MRKPAEEGDGHAVRGGDTWAKRLAAAMAIVTAIVVAAPLSQAASSAAEPGGDPIIGSSIRAHDLVGDGDAEQVLSRIEELADAGGERSVPDGFEGEIGFLPDVRDIRTSGPIVGYVVDGSAADAFDRLCVLMESRGWNSVPIGEANGATFMKGSGTLTWALVTCTQVGDATTVVFRLRG